MQLVKLPNFSNILVIIEILTSCIYSIYLRTSAEFGIPNLPVYRYEGLKFTGTKVRTKLRTIERPRGDHHRQKSDRLVAAAADGQALLMIEEIYQIYYNANLSLGKLWSKKYHVLIIKPETKGHPIKLLIGNPESSSLTLPGTGQREGGFRAVSPVAVYLWQNRVT